VDYGDSAELATFRQELRRWLRAHLPAPRPSGEPEARYLQRWHQELHRGGWVGLSWPTEHGGKGLTHSYEALLNEEIGLAGAPDAPRIAYLGRAILEYGTDEQKQRLLPSMLSGEDFWSQGFSEPDAGSDLANLSTRAERHDDHYLVTGQKVWTSFGEFADWCLLLARTGDQRERHAGITAFAVPMQAPGIEVRPLRAITGDSEFCEMFFSEAPVGVENRIGAEGDGWAIAMMTVAYERGAADVGYLSKFERAVALLQRNIHHDPGAATDFEEELDRVTVDYHVLKYHVRRRLREREVSSAPPGAEMSVDKILMTSVDQAIHQLAVDLVGRGLLPQEDDEWWHRYLYSRAASVYGGTQQIQLNIIAQRLLGLPRG
jgi:alkylation response protein AidB-like acyl-CoA dehydrogenase